MTIKLKSARLFGPVRSDRGPVEYSSQSGSFGYGAVPLPATGSRAGRAMHVATVRLAVLALAVLTRPVMHAAAQETQVIDWVNVRNFGAKGDGKADDTEALVRAIAEAARRRTPVYLPAGTYRTRTLAVPSGSIIRGAGKLWNTELRAIGGTTVFDVSRNDRMTTGYAIEISDLKLTAEAGGTGHGVYASMANAGTTQLVLRDLWIAGFRGSGVRLEGEWTTRLEGVTVDDSGEDNFYLLGGNTTLLMNCYAKRTAPGKAGYRILRGWPVMIACNGIDPPSVNADWGVFGQSTAAGDTRDSTASVTLIGCNVEDFSNRGIYLKRGSSVDIFNSSFQAPKQGVVRAVYAEESRQPGLWTGGNVVMTKGAAWANGRPIHVGGPHCPFVKMGSAAFEDVWVDGERRALPCNRIETDSSGSGSGLRISGIAVGAAPVASAVVARLSGAVQWNPGTIEPGGFTTGVVPVQGARPGDVVSVGFGGQLPRGTFLSGNVERPDAVVVTIVNASGQRATISPAVLRAQVER